MELFLRVCFFIYKGFDENYIPWYISTLICKNLLDKGWNYLSEDLLSYRKDDEYLKEPGRLLDMT